MNGTTPFMRLAASGRQGFTLLEVVLASTAAAIILVAVYGLFFHAMKLRNSAMERVRVAGVRARATRVIRDDLRNAWISGGQFANVLVGSNGSSGGGDTSFPGYLKFMTTTGRDLVDEPYGDVQQVEYYITRGAGSLAGSDGGVLLRVATRDLMSPTPQVVHQEPLLTGVRAMQVTFYDGTTWQTSWTLTGTNSQSSATSQTSSTTSTSGTTGGLATSGTNTVPQMVRVEIDQVPPAPGDPEPVPIEILVPWTAQPSQ